jgi:hypothetical protein
MYHEVLFKFLIASMKHLQILDILPEASFESPPVRRSKNYSSRDTIPLHKTSNAALLGATVELQWFYLQNSACTKKLCHIRAPEG